MLIEILVVGALYARIKARRQHQPKRKHKKKQIEVLQTNRDVLQSGQISLSPQAAIKPIKTSLPSEEASVNRDLMLSVALTGIAGIGTLVSPLLSLATIPGFVYLSLPIFKKAYQLMKQRKVSIETILTLSCVTAFSTGFIFLMGLTYVLFYVGEKLILKVQNKTTQSFIDVFKQYPRFAWTPVDNVEVRTRIEDLKKGDIVIVHTGETIPVDGIIVEGTASIDQHILTGESQLAEKEVGDDVFAATIVLSGQLCIKVEKAGKETTVARIGDILNNTTDFKSKTQLRAETLATQTVLPTILLSGTALPFLGVSSALCILQSHFSYRIRLVAPISTLSYFKLMSNNSILVKDGRTLDLLNEIDTIVFDKTGTLTQEQPHVGNIYCCVHYSEAEVLAYAAAAEQKQTHPIAKAIVTEAEQRNIAIKKIDHANYKIGHGITVSIDGQSVHVGSERFMTQLAIPNSLVQSQEECHRQGHSFVMVAIDNTVIGLIELKPTLRPEAKTVIRQLRQRKNIKTMYIISGDQTAPTQKLAHDLGIEHYFAETLPEQKATLIEQLQAEGKSICFIGDGINDSIALKKAQVSISLKGASSVATDTAQIVLMDGKLNQLPLLFKMAEEFHHNINTGFMALLIPSLFGMGGALFLHFGLSQAVILTQAGLVAGIANGIRPRLKAVRRREINVGKKDIL